MGIWSSGLKFSKQFQECTDKHSTCGGWERDDPITINEDYVTWLEKFVDEEKVNKAVEEAKSKKKKEKEQPKKKITTRLLME